MLPHYSVVSRAVLGCCLLVALLVLPAATAPAATMVIYYTGLDLSYDGQTITTVGNYDSLDSVDFKIDGTKVLALDSPEDSPLDISLSVPGVVNMSVLGDSILSDPGGTLSLLLPDGDHLDLELGAANVVYTPLQSLQMYFLLAAGSANVVSQMLPVGSYADDIAISFSTQVVGSVSDDGSVVTGFLSSGTGEIEGTAVPEPTTVALLISGLLACLVGVRRRG